MVILLLSAFIRHIIGSVTWLRSSGGSTSEQASHWQMTCFYALATASALDLMAARLSDRRSKSPANPREPTSTSVHLISHLFLQQVRMLFFFPCTFFHPPLPKRSQLQEDELFCSPVERLGSHSRLGDVCWNFQLSIQVTSHWEHANKTILVLFLQFCAS